MKNQTITLKIGFAISFLFFLSESSFTQSLSICKGECAENIGVQTMGCFKWIPEEGLSDPASSVTDACPNNTTEYNLIITNNEGDVIQSLNYSVQVNDIGVSIVPENPVLCSGSSRRLEATVWGTVTSFTFLWTTGEGTPIIEVEQPGTYSVTVTNIYDNCQDVATVEVTEESTSVSINASSTEVCEGSPITLEAIPLNQNGNYSFSWSNGASNAVISVEHSGVYSVTATDLETDCESSGEITLSSVNISTQILPEEPIACPGKKATLEVAGGPYQTIEWSTGEYGAVTIMVEEGEYSVTVTNDQGCQATASVTVESSYDPIAIREYFESKGFYAVDITILGPALRPEEPGDEKIEYVQSSICSETDPCEGNNGCVQNDANLEISIGGTDISNLEEIVAGNLEYFKSEFGYNNTKAYITKNEDICFCDEFDYLAKTETFFENGELVHWIHLWESGTLETDKLFMLTNVPSLDEHIPGGFEDRREFLRSGLEVVAQDNSFGNLPTEGEQILFSLLDNSLDNHLSISPFVNDGSGPYRPVCESFILKDAIGMAPSDIPIQLPNQSILRFGTPPNWNGIFPAGALAGFTRVSDDGTDSRYYNARSNAEGTVFEGYYEITFKGGWQIETNLFNPYTSLSFVDPPIVTLGYQTAPGTYVAQQREYTCSLPIAPGTGEGTIVPQLNLTCLGDIIIDSPPYSIDLPPLTQAVFEPPEQHVICNWGQGILQGTLVQIQQANGDSDYFHISSDDANPGTYLFHLWNCVTGLWEPYILNETSITDQLILEHSLCEFGSGDGEGDGNEDIHAPNCFELTAEQIGDFSFNGTPSFNGNIHDYVGINYEEISEIQTAIQDGMNWWNFNMNVILSGDYQPNSGDIPLGSAADEFSNYDMSTTDFLLWVHYKNDGSAGFCVKFNDSFFDNAGDEDEKKKSKAVIIDGIIDSRNVNESTHIDNPIVDPDDPPGIPSNNSPWKFGVREGYEEKLTFFNVVKEVPAVAKNIISDGEIPRKLWEKDGDCLFDTPGAVMGPADAVISENPAVAIANGISFGVSFVKDEETRHGIVQAIKHPGKVIRGIAQAKWEAYSGQNGHEAMHYEVGKDGTSLIFSLLTLTFVDNFLNGLSEGAKDAAVQLKKKLDEAPENFDDAFFLEFENVDDLIQQEYLEFFENIGIEHYAKLTKNPKLFRVWNEFKGVQGIDLQVIFKKFPDPSNTDFYNKFDEIFFNGSQNPLAKTETFLKDLDGNGSLLNTFANDPLTIETWDFAKINAYPTNIRTNIGFIESFSVALQRGVMEIGEVLNNVTLNKLTPNSVEHILRGNPVGHPDPTGGFHHASSIINRTDIIMINERTPFGNHGAYKTWLQFPNGQFKPKTFFPDNWDEIKTIQEIEYAYLHQLSPQPPGLPSYAKIGLSSEGMKIWMTYSGGTINSAYPWN